MLMKRDLRLSSQLNPLKPNDLYISRTAPLTSKRCILYIYSTNIGTELRVSYQLDANIVHFNSTCFGPIRPSSGAIEFIISFTNAAYGVLGAARCLEERARWW